MAASQASGTYFDGLTARPHPVTLRLTDRLEIVGRDISVAWDLADIVAGETPPPLMRLSVVGESARIEFTDEVFARAVFVLCPDLYRPEARDAGGRWRLVLWSVAAGLSVLLVAIYGVPALAVRLAPLVPDAIESRLGAAVDGQIVNILGDPPACNDAPAQAVLDRLVARMIQGRGLPSDLRLTVRRHAMANALTLPGGRVIVLSNLIAQAQNADEFAAILAHEFGHVVARDPTRSLIQATGSSFLLSLVLGDLTGSTIIVAFGQAAVSAGYSRDAERTADDYAVTMMEAAGGDAFALATMLERIAKDGAKDGSKRNLTNFLRSHPFTAERAARIRALASPGSAGRRILPDEDWAVLKRICTKAAPATEP